MDISHVLCFKNAIDAEKKANQFILDGLNVRLIRETDIVICDDFVGNPKVSNSTDDFDWTVVIATKKPIEAPGD